MPNDTPTPDITLAEAEAAFLEPYLADGWRLVRRRRQPLMCPLDPSAKVALGEQAANVDRELEEKRQAKNARQAALIRERNGHQGAIHQIRQRFEAGVDEIGRKMSLEDRAAYADRIAALQGQYDAFEELRKSEMSDLGKQLEELEEQASTIARKLRAGRGNRPVSVVDLRKDGTILTIRLDVGQTVSTARAPKADAEGGEQLHLMPDPPTPEHEPLNDHEYALAISGRLHDAGHAYLTRLKLEIGIPAAARIVRSLLPDEELPPPNEEESAAAPQQQPPPDLAGQAEAELPPERDDAAPEADPVFDVVITAIAPRRRSKVALVLHDQRWDAAKDWSAEQALKTLPCTAHERLPHGVAEMKADALRDAGATVDVVRVGGEE